MRPNRLVEHNAFVGGQRDRLRATLQQVLAPDSHFVWEVGCGHGHFLNSYATAKPGERCVGIDISLDRIARALRKRERARLANVEFLLADADDFLAVMPELARFTAIYILFPDPWPKRRHHKNRLMNPAFLTAVAAHAEKGTPLYFRTDHEPYFGDAVDAVRAHAGWAESDAAWPHEEPTVFQKRAATHFSLVAARR